MVNQFWTTLTANCFELLALITLAALKATFLLAFVALLCTIYRRFSAATRHLLWTFALCASLLLPFLSFVKGWEIPILPTFSVSTVSEANDEAFRASEERLQQNLLFSPDARHLSEKETEFQTSAKFVEEPVLASNSTSLQPEKTPLFTQMINWAFVVWFGVVLLLLFRLLIGFASTNLLARRAAEFEEPEINELFSALLREFSLKNTVRLLRSERISMPVVCGIFHARVLLPAEARDWSEERLRMVLLHELAHVSRRDCLTQVLAQIACAFYWFNPFVWSAARRLRIEREQACDDYVVSLGTKPSDYAHHLLEIARSMQERSIFEWSQTASVAMARRSQLEGRLVAILSKENKCTVLSRAATAAVIALICFLFVSLAIIRPTAISAQKPGVSETALSDENKTSLLDSFLSIGSEQENNTTNDSETLRTTDKQETAANDGKELKDALIDKNLGQQIAENVEGSMKQNAPESLPPPPGNILLPEQAPDVPLQPESAQVAIKYEPEKSSSVQEKAQDFIEEMASVGYTNLSVEQLVELKAVGVNANYVRSLRALGFNNLKVRELTNLRAVGVTPAYIEGIRNAGYKDLTAGQYANMRALGVTPELINKYRNAGYDNLSVGNLTEFSAHNITTDFISAMNNIGFGKLSPRELVEARIFNVTAEFVRQARSRLGNDLTLRQIIQLKNTGILKEKNKNEE
jgi:beta-lactamase regulating signal transducer with metallopeptidase domain